MGELNEKEVLHVANLAKLEVYDNDIPDLKIELKQIMNEIDKIQTLEIEADAPIFISPSLNQNIYEEDTPSTHLSLEEIKKNAPKTKGSYIEVEGANND